MKLEIIPESKLKNIIDYQVSYRMVLDNMLWVVRALNGKCYLKNKYISIVI